MDRHGRAGPQTSPGPQINPQGFEGVTGSTLLRDGALGCLPRVGTAFAVCVQGLWFWNFLLIPLH